MESDSWGQIECLFPYKSLCKPLSYDGIVVNGAVHWLVSKVADGTFVIMSFLLAEEEVRDWLCITLVSERNAWNAGETFNEFVC
ncbi:hypothetical protein RchiOBHm_Chr2g0090961 [Rosa chinensis]|uniref:Uncharacterized protein n=1 Tax=Rosa chinensis TaxID=74649 RepID=A0A2P6RJJ9_ROSCH|nr:hypothetical protein RchiOBHm_Chr2g0090961 [Rosa chinensis]